MEYCQKGLWDGTPSYWQRTWFLSSAIHCYLKNHEKNGASNNTTFHKSLLATYWFILMKRGKAGKGIDPGHRQRLSQPCHVVHADGIYKVMSWPSIRVDLGDFSQILRSNCSSVVIRSTTIRLRDVVRKLLTSPPFRRLLADLSVLFRLFAFPAFCPFSPFFYAFSLPFLQF